MNEMRSVVNASLNGPLFFVTPDPLMAIGLENMINNFHILCLDTSPVIKILRDKGINVFCLSEKTNEASLRSSKHILKHERTQEYIREVLKSDEVANILVFKPYYNVESLLNELQVMYRFRVLNTTPELNKLFEDKVSAYSLFKELKVNLPKTKLSKVTDLDWGDITREVANNVVIQFGRGWAGATTYFVNSEQDLHCLQQENEYPNLECRVSEYIEGSTFIVNACVTKSGLVYGYPFEQVTGIEELTPYQGGTCGNIFRKLSLSSRALDSIVSQVESVGHYMKTRGYQGIFGVDFIYSPKLDKVFLSEVNARLIASLPMYTKLELRNNLPPLLLIHIAEYLDCPNIEPLIGKRRGEIFKQFDGLKLIARNIHKTSKILHFLPKSGVYSALDNTYLREEYSVETLGFREYLILSAGEQTVANPGIEYLKIHSIEKFSQEKYDEMFHTFTKHIAQVEYEENKR